MARIAGVNIPSAKRVVIALTYIHGIGNAKAQEIIEKADIEVTRRVADLTELEVSRLREIHSRFCVLLVTGVALSDFVRRLIA